jgi:hypothetical protein
MPFHIGIAVTGDAIFLVAPGVERTRRRDDDGVPRSTGDLRDLQTHESFHTFGRTTTGFIAMSELAVHTTTPGPEIAATSHGRRMIGPARDGGDDAAGQGLAEARHILPTGATMAQAAIVAAAPREDFPVRGQDDGMTRAAGDLAGADASKCVDL